jgi:hypothetical protein
MRGQLLNVWSKMFASLLFLHSLAVFSPIGSAEAAERGFEA